MYSLSIHFGPNAMVWAFLFKDKEKAEEAFQLANRNLHETRNGFNITDDFGQHGRFEYNSLHGTLLEDLDLGEEARIQRSLAEAHVKVKLDQRAKTDPIIRQAMNSQGPSVLTPVPRYS